MKSLSNRATFSYGAQILDFGMPAPNADARPVLPIFPTPGFQLAFRGAIRPATPEGSEVIDERSFLENLMRTCAFVFSTAGRWQVGQRRHTRIQLLYRLRRRCSPQTTLCLAVLECLTLRFVGLGGLTLVLS